MFSVQIVYRFSLWLLCQDLWCFIYISKVFSYILVILDGPYLSNKQMIKTESVILHFLDFYVKIYGLCC